MSVQWLAALPPDVFGDKAWKITSQWCRPTYNHWRDTFSPTLSDNISRRIEMSQDGKLNVLMKLETTIYLSSSALYLSIYMGKTSKSECRWWWPESSFVCLSDQNEFYAAMAIFWQTSTDHFHVEQLLSRLLSPSHTESPPLQVLDWGTALGTHFWSVLKSQTLFGDRGGVPTRAGAGLTRHPIQRWARLFRLGTCAQTLCWSWW